MVPNCQYGPARPRALVDEHAMSVYVFTGPYAAADEAARACSTPSYLPPVSQGDVYRVALERPRAIGIIDGYFERVPAVWHKEILWAMTQGIHVFGSASMGALRAAELEAFGMEGVGADLRGLPQRRARGRRRGRRRCTAPRTRAIALDPRRWSISAPRSPRLTRRGHLGRHALGLAAHRQGPLLSGAGRIRRCSARPATRGLPAAEMAALCSGGCPPGK